MFACNSMDPAPNVVQQEAVGRRLRCFGAAKAVYNLDNLRVDINAGTQTKSEGHRPTSSAYSLQPES
jgi:hypothetical protein